MIDRIVAIYCLCDDFLKSKGFSDWHNVKMSDAEIMTVFIVANIEFYGNLEKSRRFLHEHHYMKKMLEKSRFCRRLHRLDDSFWQELISFVLRKGSIFGLPDEFLVDSFPIRVCHNIRMNRCRLFSEKCYRGFIATKKEYFRGLKMHVVTTTIGRPVVAWITPGKVHDLAAFREQKPWENLPNGSKTYGDAAYLDYELEAELEKEGKRLIARRRGNSKNPLYASDLLSLMGLRRVIETAFSKIAVNMPKKIHAITEKGFKIKAFGLVAALAISFAII